jgi:uncharacterized protein (DUF2237 family)
MNPNFFLAKKNLLIKIKFIPLIMFIILISNTKQGKLKQGQLNVYDKPLELCSLNPLTGWLRDGYAKASPDDPGNHTVCAIVSREFLDYQKTVGNDLITPRPEYNFPGLKEGDKWALCKVRWLQSYNAGNACKVILGATNKQALDTIPLATLEKFAYKN